MQPEITALMLCGGRGTRMGGEDKGLLDIDGKPLAALTLERLRAQTGQQLISANRNLARYRALGVPVLTDQRPGFPGPLAGVERGLQAAETDLVLVTPCDAPLLPLDLASRLQSALNEAGATIAVANDGVRDQVLHALVKRDLLADLCAYLDAGEQAVHRWLLRQHLARADFSDQPAAFVNLNTPAQLAALRQQLGNDG